MRFAIINFLRVHPFILNVFWKIAHVFFLLIGIFIPVKNKTMIITSFAGRKYDDSPRAIYEEILKRDEFKDWDIIWAFVNPADFEIPKGRKIKIDSWSFFIALLYSKVWISNSGMDRNIGIYHKETIKVETWHGTPLKKIGIDQNSGTLGNYKPNKKIDYKTIRCAQSEYDRDIFMRVFNASKDSFVLSDLPRNDSLLRYSGKQVNIIKNNLSIDDGKKIILYMPTYREFLINDKNETFIAPPIDLVKWEKLLSDKYVLLIRAHYAVNAALDLKESDFVKNVSNYSYINDLYAIADILISDYSSSFFDYSILDRPMICFAYDEEEYSNKRGLYLDLRTELPCPVNKTEDEVLDRILNMDYSAECVSTHKFHLKYAPHAGNASKVIVDEICKSLSKGHD